MSIEYKVERIIETRNSDVVRDDVRVERITTTRWDKSSSDITTSSRCLAIPTDELPTLIGKLQALVEKELR